MNDKNNARAGETATGATAITDGEMIDKDNGIPQISGTLNDAAKDAAKTKDLFLVRTANGCLKDASNRPIPKMLFGEFWFEGELCILFADTNTGKSIAAIQIGDSISKGKSISDIKMEAKPQTVLCFDFELSDKQFEARYSENFSNHYQFNDRFRRAEINPDADMSEAYKGDFERYLYDSMEAAILETGATVLILDNITYLKSATEKAQDALPLMKYLKALKTKYGLSVLCLAHTPKRDSSKPIGRNDVQGSKMLINFCDSAFSIGESFNDTNARYLKQIKARNTEIIYDSDNVILCQIVKRTNFLQFEFLGFANERDHLKFQTEQDTAKRNELIGKYKSEGLKNTEIAEKLGLSEGAIRKRLKKMEDETRKAENL